MLAPILRIVATAVMFAIAAAVWSIVDAPDAYAATRAEILASPAVLLLAVPFFGTALGLTLAILFIRRRDQ